MADRKRQPSPPALPLQLVARQRTNPNAMSSAAGKAQGTRQSQSGSCSDSHMLADSAPDLAPSQCPSLYARLYKCRISGSHFSPATRAPPSELAFTMLFARVDPRKQNSSAYSTLVGRLQHANAINTPADKPEMESCCWPMAAQHVAVLLPKLAAHFSTGLNWTRLDFPCFFPAWPCSKSISWKLIVYACV